MDKERVVEIILPASGAPAAAAAARCTQPPNPRGLPRAGSRRLGGAPPSAATPARAATASCRVLLLRLVTTSKGQAEGADAGRQRRGRGRSADLKLQHARPDQLWRRGPRVERESVWAFGAGGAAHAGRVLQREQVRRGRLGGAARFAGGEGGRRPGSNSPRPWRRDDPRDVRGIPRQRRAAGGRRGGLAHADVPASGAEV